MTRDPRTNVSEAVKEGVYRCFIETDDQNHPVNRHVSQEARQRVISSTWADLGSSAWRVFSTFFRLRTLGCVERYRTFR